MRLIGREPAAKGIFEVAHMPQMIAALEQAVAADEAARKQDGDEAKAKEPKGDGVSLRQRTPGRRGSGSRFGRKRGSQ